MKINSQSIPVKSLMSFIWQFVRLQPWSFFFIYFLFLTWSVDSTVWPYLLGLVIDASHSMTWIEPRHGIDLKWLFVAAVCLWISVEVFFRARDFIRARAFPKLEANVRMAMFDHIQHHSPKYFNEHFAGAFLIKLGI